MAAVVVSVLLGAPPSLHGATTREIGPTARWCDELATLPPGAELILRPGNYPGPCTIRQGGAPGAPVIIRAKDARALPRIVYDGTTSNVLHIRASHVVLRGLRFGPTAPNVDAIRLIEGHDVTIEDCVFGDVLGIVLTVNQTSTHDISVRRNRIVGSGSTAMYFGCHDGRECRASRLLVEQNYIDGVRAGPGLVGYGIQVKLNSTATIRDNVIADTKGPGIMVYGTEDPTQLSVIERNFVTGSRMSSAIVVGGGPAMVRNNITTSSAEAGISLENYGARGLLRDITVVHNTVWDNAQGGITGPLFGPVEARILNNAVHARTGTRAFPAVNAGIESAGNVDCSPRVCFQDPSQRDFSPLGLSPAASLDARWAPTDDYFGQPRGTAVAGAIQGASPPVRLQRKRVR